ncbi:hypothetical protein BDW68DRAFT_120528 [Aspergillus falconensis]
MQIDSSDLLSQRTSASTSFCSSSYTPRKVTTEHLLTCIYSYTHSWHTLASTSYPVPRNCRKFLRSLTDLPNHQPSRPFTSYVAEVCTHVHLPRPVVPNTTRAHRQIVAPRTYHPIFAPRVRTQRLILNRSSSVVLSIWSTEVSYALPVLILTTTPAIADTPTNTAWHRRI